MGKDSKIAWTDHTFNPVWGCTKVSHGCDNCYASTQANRFGDWWGVGKPRREFGDKHWNEPLKWNRKAEQSGIRQRVFCASMADVFDKDWPDGVRARLWALIKATPWLDWIIVTKRIGNAKKMLPDDWGDGYPNVWLLITVVNQREYDRDFMKLAAIPAAVRGLSIEPQLGPVDLHMAGTMPKTISPSYTLVGSYIKWVITGAESGHGNRPYLEKWTRSLRDQCLDFDVSFFYKQNVVNGKKIETPELDGVRHIAWPETS